MSSPKRLRIPATLSVVVLAGVTVGCPRQDHPDADLEPCTGRTVTSPPVCRADNGCVHMYNGLELTLISCPADGGCVNRTAPDGAFVYEPCPGLRCENRFLPDGTPLLYSCRDDRGRYTECHEERYYYPDGAVHIGTPFC